MLIEPFHIVRAGGVRNDRQRVLAEHLCGASQFLRITPADHHTRAFGHESFGGGKAYATAAAGHYREYVFQ
ncbi:hypothetical protein NK8_43480 [Caballeronia sp. NK8]|nr:hypothetical protein NK8_43480 [Caballeronia sp. NK8]